MLHPHAPDNLSAVLPAEMSQHGGAGAPAVRAGCSHRVHAASFALPQYGPVRQQEQLPPTQEPSVGPAPRFWTQLLHRRVVHSSASEGGDRVVAPRAFQRRQAVVLRLQIALGVSPLGKGGTSAADAPLAWQRAPVCLACLACMCLRARARVLLAAPSETAQLSPRHAGRSLTATSGRTSQARASRSTTLRAKVTRRVQTSSKLCTSTARSTFLTV